MDGGNCDSSSGVGRRALKIHFWSNPKWRNETLYISEMAKAEDLKYGAHLIRRVTWTVQLLQTLKLKQTIIYSDPAKAASNVLTLSFAVKRSEPPSNTMCLMPPKSLHPKKDLNSFSRFAGRRRVTDSLTDTPRYRNIGRNSPHLMHSMISSCNCFFVTCDTLSVIKVALVIKTTIKIIITFIN